MKYVYGPVPSRRLGNSLGIDPIPSKTCNYQCIYCQLGKTTNFTNERRNYCPKQGIIVEMKQALENSESEIDYITFVGSGEPTLYKDLEDLVLAARKYSHKPTCVITNGALLYDPEVRKPLKSVNVVLPSFDAGDEKMFIRINRPHPSIKFEKVVQGFIDFRKNYEGEFRVEIMVLRGINDSKEELIKIKNNLDLIQPDIIDINVPIRPPVEKWVKIPDKSVIATLNEVFGHYSDINFPEFGSFKIYSSDFEKELLNIIERHPMRQDQIINTFFSHCYSKDGILSQLEKLESEKKIKKEIYNQKIFWKTF